ncbi:hypothetical protein BCR42DRAFT_398534 [Absidia repens]|uniref:Uncharacterized protein n=1 Tax=Absidia repens TaxID=90262 RepID=A0A1X2HXJ8_9FUNG|nr:hypothetical protein BCR42DRAFT_398534 [Absidia repens]
MASKTNRTIEDTEDLRPGGIMYIVEQRNIRNAIGYYEVKAMLMASTPTISARPHFAKILWILVIEPPRTKWPICDKQRYLKDAVPLARIRVASIGDIIGAKLANPVTRKQLLYRSNRQNNTNDIFDGQAYKNICELGQFDMKYDVAIGLYIDEFSPFEKSSFKNTFVNMMKLQFGSQRNPRKSCKHPYLSDAVVQRIREFIGTWHYRENRRHTVPAVSSLVNHFWHTSFDGCRCCTIKGTHSKDEYDMYCTVLHILGRTSRFEMRTIDNYRSIVEKAIPYLADKTVSEIMNNLVIAIHLCLQRSISMDDIGLGTTPKKNISVNKAWSKFSYGGNRL